jgi:transcriptional regulator with XRE-family HTH domain
MTSMAQGFTDIFAAALEQAQILRKDFAAKAGTSPGFITDVIQGRRTPPMDRINQWAEILGLTGRKREAFFDLAAIAHLPPEAQPRFLSILQRIDKLENLAQSLSRAGGKRSR